jgi:ATP-dependent metalloprotease
MAVLLENAGLLKAGPRQAEFEPLQQKTVKFTDVHGVDEVKEVRLIPPPTPF